MKTLIPALVCLFLAIPCQAGVIYVDDDADVGGDGLSWGTAYKYLQDALLADATSGDQVWVAAGTYKPDQDEGGNVTPGNRNYSFKLINGVGIYGGFPSGGAWEDRDPNTYETILSGDIGVPDANNDNSYHVVVALWAEETAVLEGFAITGGNANGTAVDQKWGGGTLNIGSDPTVTNCTFTGNSAEDGGGMFNYNRSNPTVTNCTFTNNTVLGGGGGMYNEDRSNPMVTNCTFSGNEAAHGGGMFSRDSSNPTVSKCTFCDNIANIDGGGMRNNSSDPTVTNCTFMGNSASKDGGGMYNASGSPTVTNCTFTNNTALGVSSGGGGGGMHNNISNSEVTNCTFTGNSASKDGGGMENSNSDPTVTNCTFTGNSAVWDGGGMDNWASSPILTNCTFSGNESGWLGGGMYNVSGSHTVTNCILWGNSDSGGTDESAQIHNLSSTPVINYCCVQGWTGALGGVSNIDADPCFADPCNGDYHLKSFGWRWDPNLYRSSDFTQDGIVNFKDFANLAGFWLFEASNLPVDLNRDGTVNLEDLSIFSKKFLTSGGTGGWTCDFVTSRCIDAGNPGSPLADELMSVPDDPCNIWGENIRINMGAYGGTAEASMPPYDWALLSDITNDGTVDFVDFAHVADMFTSQGGELPGDFDRDGDVDLADLDWLTNDWLLQTIWFEP